MIVVVLVMMVKRWRRGRRGLRDYWVNVNFFFGPDRTDPIRDSRVWPARAKKREAQRGTRFDAQADRERERRVNIHH